MDQFLRGFITAGTFVIALFFYRFYRKSKDRLFLCFSVSFTLLALNRFGAAFATQYEFTSLIFYWVRAFAYLLILIVIIDKNWPQKGSHRTP